MFDSKPTAVRATTQAALSAIALGFACAQPQNEPYGSIQTVGTIDGGQTASGGSGAVGTESASSASVASTSAGGATSTATVASSTTDTESSSSATTSVASSSATSTTSSVTSTTVSATTSSGTTGADACPDDPDKTEPGECGCGVPDDDSDDDGTSDCIDECPDDMDKISPGGCGCGAPDDAECTALVNALVHRYSFDGSSTSIGDSVGNANGTALGASPSGGSLSLSDGQYVDLPNGIVSALTSATFEVWVNWSGGDAWQRIFDFGVSEGGENVPDTGTAYLFLTPRAVDESGSVRVSFTTSGPENETYVEGGSALPAGTLVHVAVSVGSSLSLYVNGASQGSETLSESLSAIDDVNNWLGLSQFSADPGFAGVLTEFRIYDAALTAAQIQKSYELGPDAPLTQ